MQADQNAMPIPSGLRCSVLCDDTRDGWLAYVVDPGCVLDRTFLGIDLERCAGRQRIIQIDLAA
jgi:hypothetical protein